MAAEKPFAGRRRFSMARNRIGWGECRFFDFLSVIRVLLAQIGPLDSHNTWISFWGAGQLDTVYPENAGKTVTLG